MKSEKVEYKLPHNILMVTIVNSDHCKYQIKHPSLVKTAVITNMELKGVLPHMAGCHK
jgi:hypothetical protein